MRKIGVLVLATLVLASVHLAEAQQPKKVPRIGALSAGSSGPSLLLERIRRGERDCNEQAKKMNQFIRENRLPVKLVEISLPEAEESDPDCE